MLEFLGFIKELIFNILNPLYSFFINGFQFFFAIFVKLPDLLINSFMNLPDFIQVGLTGAFGFVCFIVILKVVALVFLNG